MFNLTQLDKVITDILTRADVYSDSAKILLIGTCRIESNLGTYLYQVNGPALGMYQMEPATEYDLIKNYIRYNIDYHKVMMEFPRYVEIYNEINPKNL